MSGIREIPGGICAPKGYTASGIHCGIRHGRTKRDLALIYSEKRAAAAAVYTQNLVKGAPLDVTRAHIADGFAQAVVCNSGNANTCNADGIEIAEAICRLTGKALGIAAEDVIVASTGVIGQPLSIAPFETGVPAGAESLGGDAEHSLRAAEAIMTTDTLVKEIAVEFTLGGKPCRLGGIAKGSGMIHPNMATMLVFLTTDAAVSPAMLQRALSEDVKDSFNMISVDGDTSTNDMATILANGCAGNEPVTAEGEDFDRFREALAVVTRYLCRCIALDGEGATHLLECHVSGAADADTARVAAKSVICSSLVKAAFFGADANWGRILCALGYSGAKLDVSKIGVTLRSGAGEIVVCKNGAGVEFSEEKAKTVLTEKEICIEVTLDAGHAEATAWGCDLSYDYVKINGDYRT